MEELWRVLGIVWVSMTAACLSIGIITSTGMFFQRAWEHFNAVPVQQTVEKTVYSPTVSIPKDWSGTISLDGKDGSIGFKTTEEKGK